MRRTDLGRRMRGKTLNIPKGEIKTLEDARKKIDAITKHLDEVNRMDYDKQGSTTNTEVTTDGK